METELKNNCKNFFAKYNVEDVVYQSSKVLFILESPHKQEVKAAYPVAGSSGLEMSKFIYNNEINKPFGSLITQAKRYESLQPPLDRFAVVNTSPVPLQASALQEYELNAQESKVMNILEKLRVNYQSKTHRNQSWNIIKKELVNNFKQRLLKAIEMSNCNYIIPCGKLAAAYLELIAEQDLIQQVDIVTGIPHPAFNQWSYFESMNKLEKIINQL